jgi:hypothetical protein
MGDEKEVLLDNLNEGPEDDEDVEISDDDEFGGEWEEITEDDEVEDETDEEDGQSEPTDPFKGKFKTQAEKDKAHLELEKHATKQAQELKEYKDILSDVFQKSGVSDETELVMTQMEQELADKFDYGIALAEQNLNQAVVMGQMSPIQKEAALERFKIQLENAQEQERTKKKSEINFKQIERLQQNHGDLLKITSIKEASQHFIGNTVKRGEILDPAETDNLFKYGKSIYDDGYKAGILAAKGKSMSDQEKRSLKSIASGGARPPAKPNKELDLKSIDPKVLGKKVDKMSEKEYNQFRKRLGMTD